MSLAETLPAAMVLFLTLVEFFDGPTPCSHTSKLQFPRLQLTGDIRMADITWTVELGGIRD
jgi:hypothetical protein